MDEHVVEPRLDLLPVQCLVAEAVDGARAAPRGPCRRCAARGRTPPRSPRPGRPRSRRAACSMPSPVASNVTRLRGAHHLVRGALHHQPPAGEIHHALAAFRLVHVVGGHQHGHAVGGHLVDHVPELAPRLGIDAGGRFVEQQQARPMQHAGGQRHALLPAARQLLRQLIGAIGQADAFQHLGNGTPAVADLVEPRDELQVLGNRQVAIEAEALRHVADLQPDARRVAQQVHAETGAAAAIRAQQAAQHADRGGLAAAVAAEEAADLAFRHLQRQPVDHHGAGRNSCAGRARRWRAPVIAARPPAGPA